MVGINSYLGLLVSWPVNRLHDGKAVFLAIPAQVSPRFGDYDVGQKFTPVCTKCAVLHRSLVSKDG